VKLSGCRRGKLLMKPVFVNGVAWSRYCAGNGGTGGASAGKVTVPREPLLLPKLQLRSSTAAARSRSSCPVALFPEDGGLSWLGVRKWLIPDARGTLPELKGADW
jgi:hypothetical protein